MEAGTPAESKDLGRVVAFTDGVMAVAITLLVLNIEVPVLPSGAGEDELVDELVKLLPSLGAYALSFALIGRYWVIHHRLFEGLRSFDGWLMFLNLLFLALIALMPFATDLSDRYGEEPVAAAVFGTIVGSAGLVHWLMATRIVRAGHAHDWHRSRAERSASMSNLLLTIVFFASVPLAFIDPRISAAMWTGTLILRLGRPH
ncbi:MAG TPA: TMEM175 family protein [Thermoleophilaceae bacterium]